MLDQGRSRHLATFGSQAREASPDPRLVQVDMKDRAADHFQKKMAACSVGITLVPRDKLCGFRARLLRSGPRDCRL